MTAADTQTYLDETGAIDFAELASDLDGIACDYPSCEPDGTLRWVASELVDRVTGEDAPSLLIGLHATSGYTVSGRITDANTVDEIIKAVARAKAVFEAGDCPHPDGQGHPDTAGENPDTIAGMVHRLNDEQEWLDYYGESFAESEERPGWLCPGFLSDIAAKTLDTLHEGRDRLFTVPDTSALDRRYLHEDGRADLTRLTLDIDEIPKGGSAELTEGASAWAARRLLDGAGQEERLPLLLTVCFAAQHSTWHEWPPALVGLLREALETVDLAPLDNPCPHDKGHPTATVELNLRPRLARFLFGDTQNSFLDVDEDAARCPRFAAEQARNLLYVCRKYLEP